jgi:hypothetical protein
LKVRGRNQDPPYRQYASQSKNEDPGNDPDRGQHDASPTMLPHDDDVTQSDAATGVGETTCGGTAIGCRVGTARSIRIVVMWAG